MQSSSGKELELNNIEFAQCIYVFFSNLRIRPLFGFYELHLLLGLRGSLLPLGLYQRAFFGTRPSSILSTCSSQSCLLLLILSIIENTHNYFLTSSFLIYPVSCIPLQILRIAFLLLVIYACLFLSLSNIRFHTAV
jgi:hypothetical protein